LCLDVVTEVDNDADCTYTDMFSFVRRS